MLEIERRYLLKYFPEGLFESPFHTVEDSMIDTGEPHSHLRLRRRDDKFELTRKYPKVIGSRQQMFEETIDLIEIEYQTLKKLTKSTNLKRRYLYKYLEHEMEIDIFFNDLTGLAKAELEFSSIESFEDFKMPPFCLIDITDEEWLAGGKLVGIKYSELAEKLGEIGYHPLTVPS